MVKAPDPPHALDPRPRTRFDSKLFNVACAVTSCFLGGSFLIVIRVLSLAAKGSLKDTLGPFALGVLALAVGAAQVVHYRTTRRRDTRMP